MSFINRNEVPEYIGQIIDVFEDFLDEKNILIENDEREDDENSAIIYGEDYGLLQDWLMDIMIRWNIIDKED